MNITQVDANATTRLATAPPAFDVDERTRADVELLGSVRFLCQSGLTAEPPSAPQRRLLALLALRSAATTSLDDLAEILGTSTGAVRTGMSRLRRTLGCGRIRTESHGYRWTGTVDVAEVERLARDRSTPNRLDVVDRALSMWRGDALSEFRHEAWAQPEACRLDELRLQLLDERAELLISSERHAEAVLALIPRVVDQPLRDRTQGLLILALAGEGRQADALRNYQQYRRYLIEQLGIEPSPWVTMVEQAVATGDPSVISGIERRSTGW